MVFIIFSLQIISTDFSFNIALAEFVANLIINQPMCNQGLINTYWVLGFCLSCEAGDRYQEKDSPRHEVLLCSKIYKKM